ncbi:MAG TPA: glycosyl hydrolase family 18 protein [Armatimonadota bacterium]|jgi:spore germination protein YaaH
MFSTRLSVKLALALAVCAPALAKPMQRDVVGYFWVPDNDSSPYWTLADHSDCLTAIAPTWLSYDASGKFNNNSDPRTLKFAKGRGLKVTPLVANSPFRADVARLIFADDAAVTRNVDLLLKTIAGLGADGINVDIEGVAPADRGLYNKFIEALCEAFHARKLVVTADLPAKTSDSPNADWAGFADYAFLGKHLDQLQLMCYDYHWSGGPAGPIAPIEWVRKVAEYAKSVAPKEKIIIGIPFYGYDWPPSGSANEVTGVRAQELLKTEGRKPEWDAEAQAHWLKYKDAAGVERTAYFEDSGSVSARLQVARETGVGGVSIWRLGDETPDFFGPLKRYRDGR